MLLLVNKQCVFRRDSAMIFHESDIQFDKLTGQQFEELCFDLLMSYNFHSLTWRQGGSDNGRDIEAKFTITNPLIGSYDEKWLIECKHYTKGVPVDKLNSKIGWADAENPQHLLIVVSSYPTNDARQWLEKIAPAKPYKIHLIESKQLKSLILAVERLISKYFIDPISKLFLEMQNNWRHHGILPDRDAFWTIKELDLARLSVWELAFLWISLDLRHPSVGSEAESQLINRHFRDLARALLSRANRNQPILPELAVAHIEHFSESSLVERDGRYGKTVLATAQYESSGDRRALYAFVYDYRMGSNRKAVGLEVLCGSDGTAYIRRVPIGAKDEVENAHKTLFARISHSVHK